MVSWAVIPHAKLSYIHVIVDGQENGNKHLILCFFMIEMLCNVLVYNFVYKNFT